MKRGVWVILFCLLFTVTFAQHNITGIVKSAAGDILAGVNIIEKGTYNGTTTNAEGVFKIKVKSAASELVFRYIGYTTVEVPINGQSELAVSMEEDALKYNEVTIMGTRRSNRTVIESAVPIDIISEQEIRSTGFTQTVEMLQNLVPSFNTFKNSITDATDYVRPAQLRGLGPEHVLILVNGKRRHLSSVVNDNEQARGSVSVDLNSIPPSAIEKIEVLRDGAAAQYGSDAIAGVINIILKKNTDLDVSVTYGQNYSHENAGYTPGEFLNGANTDASLKSGNYFDWTNNPSEKTHTDGKNIIASISKGFLIGDGIINLSLQYWKQGKSDRSGPEPGFMYWGKKPDGTYTYDAALMGNPASGITLDPREATIDRNVWWFGKSELTDISGFLNGDFPMKNNQKFYFFGGISHRDGKGPCFYRTPGHTNTVRSIFPDGYLPEGQPVVKDYSGAMGFKGNILGMLYDISQTVGHNDFRFGGKTLNVSLGNPGDLPGELSAKSQFDGGGTRFTQASTNLDLTAEVNAGLASPVNIAFGGEYRFEKYEIYAGEPAAYINGGIKINDGPYKNVTPVVGTQCVSAFHRVDQVNADRANVAAYVDAETDIVKALTLGAAGRFESYSDVEDPIFTGKLSGRYEINKMFALRGAASTGFRAPALQQQYYSNRSLQSNPDGSLKQTGTFPVESAIAKALGAQKLKAENSMSYSGGLTFTSGSFSFTADAYQVNVNDRILLSEVFFANGKGALGANGAAPFAALLDGLAGTFGPDSADYTGIRQVNYFTNGLSTKTTGLDVVLRYVLKLNNISDLRLTCAANLTDTKIINQEEIGTPVALMPYTNQTLLGHTNRTNIENGAPDYILNFILNYNRRNLSATIKPVLYGPIIAAERFAGDNPINDQKYDAQLITNLEISYKIPARGLTLSIGSNNLLDVYPEKRYKSMSKLGELPYSGYIPYGFMGRYIYTHAQFNLN